MIESIEKLSPEQGDLLVISVPHALAQEQREKMAKSFAPLVESLGVHLLIMDGGVTAQLQPNMAGLLAVQEKQVELLERIAHSVDMIRPLEVSVDYAVDGAALAEGVLKDLKESAGTLRKGC
ncbi:hypothetical protein [Pseudomonas putida]|uniref:Uncharacterized protein n=1 Tax=Pseudomonas putida TaxID=303 RepID=A0A1X0ZLU6_PSEPU|nr:hypothetical protein [Pseudomonas putida]ORL58103.1 hypothetical protein B7H17_26260 [Pseudomonas putida]